jgi:predicted NBD/HSP70 family sugar kinase
MSVLAIDVGGTAVKYAEIDRERRFLTRGSVPTPTEGREALVETIGRLYDAAADCEGIAIAMPGIIDPENGYVRMGGALRYNDDFYFREALRARCPVPVWMENDANCAAIAEAAEGCLKDVPNGMLLVFGTMVGGALIRDHELYRGSHFSAGEVSYLITRQDGLPSGETLWGERCGVPGLCRAYARAKGLPEGEVDGRRVFRAVGEGEPEALRALEEYAAEIAVQIFNLQNVYDPDRFAIGGGISAQPALIDAIRAQLGRLYAACPYRVRQAEIAACRFRNDANLYGAYFCYLQNVKA